MVILEITFWASAACVIYAYILYPLLLMALCRFKSRPLVLTGSKPQSFTIVMAARNEELRIGSRIIELVKLIENCSVTGELIVVSDGSTDKTLQVAHEIADSKVRVIEQPMSLGKSAALNAGIAVATGEIVIFADVRQRWAPDALTQLLDTFRDKTVGAVSGDLIIETSPGVLAGVGLYWKYEKWIRKLESRRYSQVGVTGAISAVRRELYHPIPEGTILDDVYWPLCVAMSRQRVVHNEFAYAYDHLPDRSRDEFNRKVRTLAGNFQLITLLPNALMPWSNPVWLELISRKILRLLVPWALIGMFVISIFIDNSLYKSIFWIQFSLYLIGISSVLLGHNFRPRKLSFIGTFVMLNAAAFASFWLWATCRSSNTWSKVNYVRIQYKS